MKGEQDAYGHEVLAYLNGHKSFEIIERDDGYIDVSGSGAPEPYFREFAAWPPHEQQAMDYATGRVLDIGCGAGRVCLHLQSKGLEVVGVDNSPLAVEVCRQRGVKNARLIPITQISAALGQFDSIVMMGNNFGLFGSFERARWLLRRFYRLTTATACIIAESTDPYQTSEQLHLAYHELNRRRGRMSGQTRLRVLFKTYRTPWFDYLLVSKGEMENILDSTGWHIAHIILSAGPSYVAVLEKG